MSRVTEPEHRGAHTGQASHSETDVIPRYRHALPQLSGPRVFLADGGLETTLVFLEGIDLPGFAAFPLVADEGGRAKLRG